MRYTNTLGDLVRFNVYHLPRMAVMQVLFGGLIVMHTCTFAPAITNEDGPTHLKIAVFLITLGMFIGALVIVQLLLIVFSYLPSKNKTVLTEHVVRITDDALVEETAFGTSVFTWSGILKVAQNRRYIFVYVQQNSAHIIPKRAFATPADAASFVTLSMSRIAANREG